MKISLFLKVIISVVLVNITIAIAVNAVIIPELKEKSFQEIKDTSYRFLDNLETSIIYSYKQLEAGKQKILEKSKSEVKNVTLVAESILKTYHQRYKRGELTFQEAKRRALESVSELRYGKDNYLFCADKDIILTAHGMKQFIGKDFSKVKGAKGKYFAIEMAKKADLHGEGFTRYWWPKIGKEGIYEKLSYIKKSEYFNQYIGSGIYLDDVARETENFDNRLSTYIGNYVNEVKIKKTGYFFVASGEGKMIYHPSKDLLGSNIKDLLIPQTEKTFFSIVSEHKDGNFHEIRYHWDKANDPGNFIYEKVLWHKYSKDLDLYIVSSVYVDELEKSINEKRDFILTTIYLVIFITIIFSFFYIRKITKPIQDLSKMALKAKRGDLSVRSDISSKDEVGILAEEFNSMLNEIELQVKTLDEKVEIRTKELNELNRTLQDSIKKAVAEIREKDQILLQKSKMAAMGEMIDFIAHQFKQPISAMSAMVNNMYFLENRGPEIERIENGLNDRIAFLAQTIDDFRNYFKTSKQKSEFSVTKAVKDSLTLIDLILKREKIEVKIKGEDFTIYGVKNELEQVLVNLLVNAKDALKNRDENREIEIQTKKSEHLFIISVSDNAGGVPQEIAEDIFKPHFSTKGDQGSGIGLYMSKMIINGMDGDIEVSNGEDGAVFTVKIAKRS